MTMTDALVIPKKERKTSSLTMYIEPSLRAKLDEMATLQGVTRSEVARFIFSVFFDEHSKKFGVTQPENQPQS